MVGVDWALVALIGAGVVVGVFLVALIAQLIRSGAKREGRITVPEPPAMPRGAAEASASNVDPLPLSAATVRTVGGGSVPGDEIVLTLVCEPLDNSEGFTREVRLVGGDGVYTWTLGSKDHDRYEHWEMKLEGSSSFAITGEYIEGEPVLKPVSFAGKIVGSIISGQGNRGPRRSTIHN